MQHANDKVVHVTLYVVAFEVCSELYDMPWRSRVCKLTH